MLDITKTPVARTIKLDLQDQGRYSGGGRIIEQAAPDTRIPVKSFVEQLYPNQIIEHLGRRDFVSVLGEYDRTPAPSSLFFQAVHKAYMDHHALGLRPEVLMYLINSVVAETVRRHPEDYRNLFTTKEGKVDIHVEHNGLVRGNAESPWDEAIELFDQALRPHVPSRIMNQMLPEFSTATTESSVASLVAFMDAASPFYDYHTHTRCGIPRIVLFGEAADYRRLVVATTELAGNFQAHLSSYFKHLLPVLEKIAKTAEGGRVDESFWSRIYKYERHSGSDTFGGWLSAFLWYVNKYDWRTKASTLIEKDAKLANWEDNQNSWNGLASGSQPSHVSRVPFKWHYFSEVFEMHFIGGVLGVDVAEGALTPNLSYGVLQA